MTPTAQIAAIRQRAEQATPGPWRTREEATPSGQLTWHGVGERGRLYVANTVEGLDEEAANAEFIAHARKDIPFLLKQIDARESALRALVAQWKQEAVIADATCNDTIAVQLHECADAVDRLLASEP